MIIYVEHFIERENAQNQWDRTGWFVNLDKLPANDRYRRTIEKSLKRQIKLPLRGDDAWNYDPCDFSIPWRFTHPYSDEHNEWNMPFTISGHVRLLVTDYLKRKTKKKQVNKIILEKFEITNQVAN